MVRIVCTASIFMVYVDVQHGSASNVKPHCFKKFHQPHFREGRNKRLQNNHLNPKEDLKEVQSPKDEARESERIGESDSISVTHNFHNFCQVVYLHT